VNGANGIFKASTTYCEKAIIWIMFQNSKIGTLTKEKYNHHYVICRNLLILHLNYQTHFQCITKNH
jgi:hypothetical protein